MMRIPSDARTQGPRPEDGPNHPGARGGLGWRARAVICGLAAVTAVALVLPVGAQSKPVLGILEVLVLARSAVSTAPRQWMDFRAGTAFFIRPDGAALTASHVVYPVRQDPQTYELVAIWNGEFYGASVICASWLPPTAMNHADMMTPPQRDLAEIHLAPAHFTFNEIRREGVRYAVAHRGPLPTFPSLEAGPDPRVGDPVRVVSYVDFGTTVPHVQQNAGTVSGFDTARDGTRLVAMRLSAAPQPGASGSPVVNAHNQAIGVFAWGFRDAGLAMTRRALDPVCR